MPWWVPFTLETLRQLVFIDTILMGIAFSFAIQLIAMRDSRTVVTSTIVMFLSAALMFLASATIGMYGILLLVTYQGAVQRALQDKPIDFPTPEWLDMAGGAPLLFSLIALTAFLIGMSILPFIHSKRLGMITLGLLLLVIILVITVVAAIDDSLRDSPSDQSEGLPQPTPSVVGNEPVPPPLHQCKAGVRIRASLSSCDDLAVNPLW